MSGYRLPPRIRKISRSSRPPPSPPPFAESARVFSDKRVLIVFTRVHYSNIRIYDALSPPLTPLSPSPSRSAPLVRMHVRTNKHVCDPACASMYAAGAATASIIIAIAETMHRSPGGDRGGGGRGEGRSIRYLALHLDISRPARLRDARPYLASQFRPVSARPRSEIRSLSFSLPRRSSSRVFPRQEGNYRSEESMDRHASSQRAIKTRSMIRWLRV